MKETPKINEVYKCFDDGKIRPSRLYTVRIDEVIPFNEIDSETLKKWNEVKQTYHWLYAEETDYFIKFIDGEEGGDGVFVRTKVGGWFGIGDIWNSGELDIDGELIKIMEEHYDL